MDDRLPRFKFFGAALAALFSSCAPCGSASSPYSATHWRTARCEIACFIVRNGPNRAAKWAVSQHDSAHIAKALLAGQILTGIKIFQSAIIVL